MVHRTERLRDTSNLTCPRCGSALKHVATTPNHRVWRCRSRLEDADIPGRRIAPDDSAERGVIIDCFFHLEALS